MRRVALLLYSYIAEPPLFVISIPTQEEEHILKLQGSLHYVKCVALSRSSPSLRSVGMTRWGGCSICGDCFGECVYVLGGLINQQSCHSADDDDENGVYLKEARAYECEYEEQDAHYELEGVVGGTSEVFGRHEQYGCCGYEAHDGRTQQGEDVAHDGGLTILEQQFADGEHEHKR